jgi:hypothetical protein
MSLRSKTHDLAPEPTADEIAALFEATNQPPHLIEAFAQRGQMVRALADRTARYRQLLDTALWLLDRVAECDGAAWGRDAQRFRDGYAAALSAPAAVSPSGRSTRQENE